MEVLRMCRDDVLLTSKVKEQHFPSINKSSLNKGKTLSHCNSSVHYVINSNKLDPNIDKKSLFLRGSFSLNENLIIKEEKPNPEQIRKINIRTFVKNRSCLNFSE